MWGVKDDGSIWEKVGPQPDGVWELRSEAGSDFADVSVAGEFGVALGADERIYYINNM